MDLSLNYRFGPIALLGLLTAPAFAGVNLGTSFAYQGELRDGETQANGVYDLTFALYADAMGTAQVGQTLCFDNVTVTEGRLNQSLDFGSAFGPDKRYLAVLVREDSAGATACETLEGYTTLGPLSPVEAAPSAHFALRADTAMSVVNADSTPATVADAQNLGGRSAGYYTSAANVAGVLPGAMLSGVFGSPVTLSNPANMLYGDGSGITGIPGATAHAAHANTATSATSALNANLLGNQLPSHYLDIANHTAPYNRNLLSGTYSSEVLFLHDNNVFQGNGAGLTSLKPTQMTTGVLPSGRISGTYSDALNFNNLGNVFFGDGTGLTNLPLNQLTAALRVENMPQMSRVISHQANTGVWSGTNPISPTFAVIPNSSKAVTDVSFAGQAIMHWSFSAGTGTAQTGFHIVPMIDGVAAAAPVLSTPMFFNTAGVHQFVGGTATFPLSAGSHTFALGYRKTSGSGNLETSSDSIQYSIIITR